LEVLIKVFISDQVFILCGSFGGTWKSYHQVGGVKISDQAVI